MNVDAVVSDNKKTTMLDLAGSPSFNYEAAAVSLNTANATRISRQLQSDSVEMDRREKIHRALQNFGLATAGASIASPPTALFTEIAGSIADLTDGILYSLEGEHGNAALSYASILPFVGAAVVAKRGMKVAEKAGEELVDIYRGVPQKFMGEQSMTKFDGEFYHVGGEFDAFRRQHPEIKEVAFKDAYRFQADDVYANYLKTGEIPFISGKTGEGIGAVRMSMKDAPFPFPYGYYNKVKPRGVDTAGNTILAKRGEYDSLFLEQKEMRNPLYDLLRTHHYTAYRPKTLVKEGKEKVSTRLMKELQEAMGKNMPRTLLGDDALAAMKDTYQRKVTTDRFLFASEHIEEAQRYGSTVLHFKVPKSYLEDLAKRNRISGYGNKVREIVNPVRVPDAKFPKGDPTRSEWIFDEGIPHRFYYRTLGVTRDLSEIR